MVVGRYQATPRPHNQIGYGITYSRILTKVLQMTRMTTKIVHTASRYPQNMAMVSISLTLHPSYGARTHIRVKDIIFGRFRVWRVCVIAEYSSKSKGGDALGEWDSVNVA